ncbi:adenylyl-sulfate kinase [Geosporobacter ferrireducens]|uniref:Adenylyl-sulfate kinase n=1 Tax=Geosporobacter ferrireducens TaxID=1424294 RepID=A0A1D8GE31_9FIRM|nr:adenylyl-sulfate kinase [Geosporobacter ferrireducens]AOT69173.1 adenylyl-sulfate kinase [Geosporobacter ferrireducens]MTI56850.1 adenylyl-sulfate kinase [Geosporobacter ferrireducens]
MSDIKNILWHDTSIKREDREAVLKQRGTVLWFTGLSGSGKSTVANAVEKRLFEERKLTYLLDGDNIRHGLNRDLGFDVADRMENIRRIAEVSKLFIDAGLITLTAFISPFREDRNKVRELLGERFIEVFVDCPLEVCEDRDPKGLYKKARAGKIKDFTGIDSLYEKPTSPEIIIRTDALSVDACANEIIHYLEVKKFIR